MLQILPKKREKMFQEKNQILPKRYVETKVILLLIMTCSGKKVCKLRLSKAVYPCQDLCAIQVFSMEWWIFRKIRLGLSCHIFNNSETNGKILRKKEFKQI